MAFLTILFSNRPDALCVKATSNASPGLAENLGLADDHRVEAGDTKEMPMARSPACQYRCGVRCSDKETGAYLPKFLRSAIAAFQVFDDGIPSTRLGWTAAAPHERRGTYTAG